VAFGATFDVNGFSDTIGSLYDITPVGGSVTLGGGHLFTGDNGNTTTFSGVISGNGYLVKLGRGTFTLSGLNTYVGRTYVLEGTLQVGVNNAVPSTTAVLVAAHAVFDVNSYTDQIGSLADDPVNPPLPFVLAVNLGNGSLFTGSDNSSTVFSGRIDGLSATGAIIGDLVKEGAGTMTLFGNNTYARTSINQGTLEVNGIQPASFVTVGASGTLAGIGTVGSTLVDGTVSPSSLFTLPGILTVMGNITFDAGSSFNVRLLSPFSFDQLIVTGTANLNGNPTLNACRGFVGTGFMMNVLQAGVGVFGTFNALPFSGMTFTDAWLGVANDLQIDYFPNVVRLTTTVI
jgi:autotransporter-associated beta strand protein